MSTEPGPQQQPAPTEPRKVPQAALIGGSALLVVGLCLIVLAVFRSGAGSGDDEAVINFTSAGDAAAAPAVIEAVTSSASSSSTPTPAAKKKAKPAAVSATTPAPKPKPKPKSTKASAKKAAPRLVPAAKTSYLLNNVITGFCAGPMVSATAALTQEKCADGNQVSLEPTRTVNGVRLYRLRTSSGANLCFDVPNFGSEPSATPISAFDCLDPSSSDNQEWSLNDTNKTKDGHAVYTVVNFKSGNCLNVQNWAADKGDRAAGLGLSIFTCSDPAWGYDDHYWFFS